MEFYSALKKSGFMGKYMELKNIILNKVIQA